MRAAVAALVLCAAIAGCGSAGPARSSSAYQSCIDGWNQSQIGPAAGRRAWRRHLTSALVTHDPGGRCVVALDPRVCSCKPNPFVGALVLVKRGRHWREYVPAPGQFMEENEGQRWLKQLRTAPNARVVSAAGELRARP